MEAATLEEALSQDGHRVMTTQSPQEAKEVLSSSNAINLVLVGSSQNSDGLEMLCWIRGQEQLEQVEVILVSDCLDPAEIKRGVAAGAYHYLTRPLEATELQALVRAALRNARVKASLTAEIARSQNAFRLMHQGLFVFRTLEEAECLAAGLSAACGAEKCLGVFELLVNAVEHGNLGIGYDEKSRLLRDGVLTREIERRLNLPENREKKVRVEIEKTSEFATISIEDEGTGFDYEAFLKFDDERSLHAHGRGLLLAGTMFELKYFPPGNRVEARIRLA